MSRMREIPSADMGERRAQLLSTIVAWGTHRDDVRALIQTGSLARSDGLVDALSDIDIEIFADDPSVLVGSDDWIRNISRPTTILHLDEDQEWSTRLVIFENGVKVDFTLAGRSRLDRMIEENTLDPLFDRGYRVLLDRDSIAALLPAPSRAIPVRPLPTQEQFRARVEEFWFEAFHVPRYLARGELFLVKQRDWTMKELLLEMMEWHALAQSEQRVDVWHNGTRLHQWTDAESWQELHKTFGHFDADDSRRAYQATVGLYARLGRAVAAANGLVYPEGVEEKIRAFDVRR